MNFSAISSVLLLLVGSAAASYPFQQVAQRYEEQTPVEQTVYSNTPQAYKFSYSTGGLQGVSDVAQHFREESRDESGYVVGKYGYVDPYGKLRVVNYRAGPEGYTASGDTGADEEGLRQQRELYASDRSYQIQQQVWQAIAAGQPFDGILASAAGGNGASAASSAAAAASAASSSSSSNGATSEWTSVQDAGHQHSSADYTNVKGQNRFVERYTAAGGVKSPAAQLRQSSTSYNGASSSSSSAAAAAAAAAASAAYTAPAVSQSVYSTKTAPIRAAPIKTAAYVQPVVTQTIYSTKSTPVQTAAVKQYSYSQQYQTPAQTIHVVKPARIVQQQQSTKNVQQQAYTSGFQSPAARLVAINNNSYNSASSAASAAAAASASASSSGAYTAGVKGYSGAIKSAPIRAAPVKVARYAVAPGGGQTVVKFSQGGPVPYAYSYNFK